MSIPTIKYLMIDLGTGFTQLPVDYNIHFTSPCNCSLYLNTINEIAIVIRSHEVACGIIRGCASTKNYYHCNVVGI